MEHAIKKEIHVKLDENPVFYQSLRERLEQLVADRKAKRIDAAEQLRLFEAIKADLRGHAGAAERVGLSETGFAIYGLLIEPPSGTRVSEARAQYGTTVDESKKALAEVLVEQLEPQTTIVDWQSKDDVQREMRRLIKRQLRAGGYSAEKVDPLAESVVALLKRRRA